MLLKISFFLSTWHHPDNYLLFFNDIQPTHSPSCIFLWWPLLTFASHLTFENSLLAVFIHLCHFLLNSGSASVQETRLSLPLTHICENLICCFHLWHITEIEASQLTLTHMKSVITIIHRDLYNCCSYNVKLNDPCIIWNTLLSSAFTLPNELLKNSVKGKSKVIVKTIVSRAR